MSGAAEAIDELSDRRRQPDASEVFMYTFAAVGALTLAEMDAASAAVPGAAAAPAAHGPSSIPPAPGAGGAPGAHSVTDSAFRAAISALTGPVEDGSETPTQSSSARSDPGALTATDSETLPSDASSAAAPMFTAPDPFRAGSLENPFASLAGDSAEFNDPSALAGYAAAPAQLGPSDFLQALGAYQTLSPEAANASVIAGFGEAPTLAAPSLGAAVRA